AVTCPRHFSRLFTLGTGSQTTSPASPIQPRRMRKMRSVCREHSYISVAGITLSSTKRHGRDQSSGGVSEPGPADPAPNLPPARPAGRGEERDAIDQPEHAAGQRGGVLQVRAGELRAERGCEITPAEGLHLLAIE